MRCWFRRGLHPMSMEKFGISLGMEAYAPGEELKPGVVLGEEEKKLQEAREEGALQERVKQLEASWPIRLEGRLAQLERPVERYRILRDPIKRKFFVLRWEVSECPLPRSRDQSYARIMGLGKDYCAWQEKEYLIKYDLPALENGPLPHISWQLMGELSFDYFTDAHSWLRQYLGHPEHTPIDAAGEIIPPAIDL